MTVLEVRNSLDELIAKGMADLPIKVQVSVEDIGTNVKAIKTNQYAVIIETVDNLWWA